MLQAITTRFLGPTNTRPSRIVAECGQGRLTKPWAHDLDQGANHRAVALQLAEQLGWAGDWRGGWTTGSGAVFVRV